MIYLCPKNQSCNSSCSSSGCEYSFKKSSSYIDTNIVGTFNILETVKNLKLKHLIVSSTSSVYGDGHNLPFHENEITNYPLSPFATRNLEVLAHSYSCSYKIPITLVRFFTVYGPWGRPDMALFKFTDSIIKKNEPIEIFNRGHLKRDSTYIDDIVNGVYEISKISPEVGSKRKLI